ncbi:MAG: CHAD domain-containing protein [Pirellulales bacterium]
MSNDTKWIEASPAEKVTEVARRALAARLESVRRRLAPAAERPEEDIEHVHQLRVATRRAMAAMRIFDDFLPTRRARWIKKQLRLIRRAAGEARDLDVLAARLRAPGPQSPESPSANVLARLAARRRRAQRPIEKIWRRLSRRGFERRVAAMVDRIRPRGKHRRAEPEFGSSARANLRPLVAEFFQAAVGDFSDLAALHRLRICGKQLRYAMEVFAGAFGAALREELYPVVEALQERLGELNDRRSARDRFRRWLDKSRDEVEKVWLQELVAAEERAIDERRRELAGWWTPELSGELARRLHKELASDCGTQG